MWLSPEKNQNYKDVLIFNNNCLPLSYRPYTLIDKAFFPEPQAKTVSVRKLFPDNILITRDSLAILCGTMITNDQYKKLKKLANNWTTRFENENALQTSEKFENFFKKSKKGSKIFKNCVLPVEEGYVLHNIIKHGKTTDSVIQINQLINLNTLWKENYFDNKTKSFILNYITIH